MKNELPLGIATLLMALALSSPAQVAVDGYETEQGTVVQPHNRTAPDETVLNNWSFKGNVNPYTGKIGSKTHGIVATGYQPTYQDIEEMKANDREWLSRQDPLRLFMQYGTRNIDEIVDERARLEKEERLNRDSRKRAAEYEARATFDDKQVRKELGQMPVKPGNTIGIVITDVATTQSPGRVNTLR